MKLLQEYYNMEEEDFVSAELEIVPAGRARDCGEVYKRQGENQD